MRLLISRIRCENYKHSLLYYQIKQAEHFKEINNSPFKKWTVTPVDLKSQELWEVYTDYKTKMFTETNSEFAPWKIIQANKKIISRIEYIRYVLDKTL